MTKETVGIWNQCCLQQYFNVKLQSESFCIAHVLNSETFIFVGVFKILYLFYPTNAIGLTATHKKPIPLIPAGSANSPFSSNSENSPSSDNSHNYKKKKTKQKQFRRFPGTSMCPEMRPCNLHDGIIHCMRHISSICQSDCSLTKILTTQHRLWTCHWQV